MKQKEALEIECEKFETWNRQLKTTLDKLINLDKEYKISKEEIARITKRLDELEAEVGCWWIYIDFFSRTLV